MVGHPIQRKDLTGRRTVLKAAAYIALDSVYARSASAVRVTSRYRAIVDNDFSGDPDGLFHLAHQLACPSTTVKLVIGSHQRPGARTDPSNRQAENAARCAQDLMKHIRFAQLPRVVAGRNASSTAGDPPHRSAAVQCIIDEAMRASDLPLFYLAGAGLSEIAAALQLEPRVARRLRLVWIGGLAYRQQSQAASNGPIEYNLAIDPAAAQFVFNESDVEIWQVPQDVYRTLLVSHAEIREGLQHAGTLGRFLMDKLEHVLDSVYPDMGETYIMGDSPLVTLSALQSSFDPNTSSSAYVLQPTPQIEIDGRYGEGRSSRMMRRYVTVDTRLTVADMWAKLRSVSR